jgi:hypothetical protein
MGLTQRSIKALFNYLFGKTSDFDTQPTVWVALSTSTPTATGTNVTEPSTGSYARVETAAGDWAAAGNITKGGSIANTNAVDFPTPTGNWGTVTHFVLYDAETTGNVIGYGPLSASKSVETDDEVTFPAGDLKITGVDDDDAS